MTERNRLQEFVAALDALVDAHADEPRILAGAKTAMQALVAVDDWLPDTMARAHPQFYQQYLLHCDPRDRFCVVSFVWGPGQKTPVHNHTVWGVIGMLRGAECATGYRQDGARIVPNGDEVTLRPGEVGVVSPAAGDIHCVHNAFADRTSISIHAYGANIGRVRRQIFDVATGAATDFVSGYANA